MKRVPVYVYNPNADNVAYITHLTVGNLTKHDVIIPYKDYEIHLTLASSVNDRYLYDKITIYDPFKKEDVTFKIVGRDTIRPIGDNLFMVFQIIDHTIMKNLESALI